MNLAKTILEIPASRLGPLGLVIGPPLCVFYIYRPLPSFSLPPAMWSPPRPMLFLYSEESSSGNYLGPSFGM